MKLKKLLISASTIAAGTGLMATVLTSCSKSHIDDDLKIDLNDEGKFIDLGEAGFIDYHDALANALSRSSGWAQFKTALAEELVYQWYKDRAASDDHPKYNKQFKNNLKDWEYNIKKDYDNIVDDCKSKYGANWKFYLQNEHLAQNGGTEEHYKHTKLVQKVKSDFIDRVFATNYYGEKSAEPNNSKFPIFFEPAQMTPGYEEMKNPENWARFGFFAKTNNAFAPTDESDVDYLAQNPDGEYATIQDYTFNRWFDTEKPFFSAAALFKYSNPAQSGGKLANIYNSDWATVPESPNEAFPFFGAVINSNDGKGTKAFYEWYQALINGEFESDGLYDPSEPNAPEDKEYNGTITMGSQYTDDSQTLLLCTANEMFSSLYTPYALAASKLYSEMLDVEHKTTSPNTMTQSELADKVGKEAPGDNDDFRILSCFFYDSTEKMPGQGTPTFTDYLDLEPIYGNTAGFADNDFHCRMFIQNNSYPYFFGDMNKAIDEDGRNGIRYITNSFEVQNLGRDVDRQARRQPWILEMNESGVHAQTIDGYQYVTSSTQTLDVFKSRLKDVVKYRLMEDKCYDTSNLISADLFGSDDKAKLKAYFKDNFANIVLEMATIPFDSTTIGKEGYYNIFRKVQDYKPDVTKPTKLFDTIVDAEKLCNDHSVLVDYLNATIDVDRRQKILTSIETVDSKIYEYRKTQIENSNSDSGKKKFENGLLAPMPAKFVSAHTEYGTTHHYSDAIQCVVIGDEWAYHGSTNQLIDRKYVYGLVDGIQKQDFIGHLNDRTQSGVQANTSEAYSPQIKKAKEVESNRFWYNSSIVDQVMYSSMSKTTLANAIKQETYAEYGREFNSESTTYKLLNIFGYDPFAKAGITDAMNPGMKATYVANKMLSGTNFAAYTSDPAEKQFYNVMFNAYKNKMDNAVLLDGQWNDDALNYWLFVTTAAYLARTIDGQPFAKLYDSLATKIHENELAYVAYASKYNDKHPEQYPTGVVPTNAMNYWYSAGETNKLLPYDWTADVDNIFDRHGYSGEGKHGDSYKKSFDQYWHVVGKNVFGDRTLSGFMGIQSASSNQFDEESGLKKAATENFKVSTYKSPKNPKNNTSEEWSTDPQTHKQNDGVLFPWAYNGTDKTKYTFAVEDPRDNPKPTITSDLFSDAGLIHASKLAYNIASCSTLDDIKSIASSLSNAIYGTSVFTQIAQSEYPIKSGDALKELKYVMIYEFYNSPTKYISYFERLQNVELHTDVATTAKYSFRNSQTGDCYKAMVTQLNKSDLADHLITPTWENGKWNFANCPITPEEFWYIFFDAASDSTNQQSAIADAVKKIYGDEKLVVYDAQLYNQFDSTWIKDWVKKPCGE